MKKVKIYFKKLELNIFNSSVNVYYYKDKDVILSYLDDLYGDNFRALAIDEDYLEGSDAIAMRITKNSIVDNLILLTKTNDYSILVHELLHVICNITETIDVNFDIDNQEVLCYMIGYLMKQHQEKKWIEIKNNTDEEKNE